MRGAGSEPELTEPETLASIRHVRAAEGLVAVGCRQDDVDARTAEIERDRRFWRQFKVILLILGLSAIILLVGVWLL